MTSELGREEIRQERVDYIELEEGEGRGEEGKGKLNKHGSEETRRTRRGRNGSRGKADRVGRRNDKPEKE